MNGRHCGLLVLRNTEDEWVAEPVPRPARSRQREPRA